VPRNCCWRGEPPIKFVSSAQRLRTLSSKRILFAREDLSPRQWSGAPLGWLCFASRVAGLEALFANDGTKLTVSYLGRAR